MDTASRLIAAPPDRVYAALIDPDALAEWLPPDGMSGRFERFDARPGGSYQMILTYADVSAAPGKATADSDVVEARFVDIVPGVRIVQAVDFVSDDPAYAGTMTMTWEVTAVGAGTHVEIRADNVPAGISADDHALGSPRRWRISPRTWSHNPGGARLRQPNRPRSCGCSTGRRRSRRPGSGAGRQPARNAIDCGPLPTQAEWEVEVAQPRGERSGHGRTVPYRRKSHGR
jgi:uncharacterized protein YndB with AHSA1/START domain